MLCGVDEAGRGPVLGPMVVAGVAIIPQDEAELVKLGARDSKRLTPGRREQLAKAIKQRWPFKLVVMPAEDIDLLRQEMTMNQMEARVFAGVIDSLVDVTHAFVDAADTNEQTFQHSIEASLKRKVDVTSKHGADDMYPVVSAASIIAKVERDRFIQTISRELGQDVGSGYPSDSTTIRFIEGWVSAHGDLPPHTRRSWKTASRILSECGKKKSIEDYGEDAK